MRSKRWLLVAALAVGLSYPGWRAWTAWRPTPAPVVTPPADPAAGQGVRVSGASYHFPDHAAGEALVLELTVTNATAVGQRVLGLSPP
jgi:hypothetical protein